MAVSDRAKRRQAARAIVSLAPDSEKDALVLALEKCETLKGWCATYKTRLERIAMALQFVSNRIIEGNIPAAQTAMRAIMANDLKEARETVGARTQALALAVEELEAQAKGRANASGYARIALDSIRTLAPEAFPVGAVAMTAEKVAHG